MEEIKDKADFEVDEVLEVKGFQFKVVLVDAFTGTVGIKQISPKEANELKEKAVD